MSTRLSDGQAWLLQRTQTVDTVYDPGMLAHVHNPSTLEADAKEAPQFEAGLVYTGSSRAGCATQQGTSQSQEHTS